MPFETMQEVIITTRPKSKKKVGGGGFLVQMDLPLHCAECPEVHAFFECNGPWADDCTVLVVNPTDPSGPKFRVHCQLTDIRPAKPVASIDELPETPLTPK